MKENQVDTYSLRDKWYGTLARRGFSLEIVKKVININDIDSAYQILEDHMK